MRLAHRPKLVTLAVSFVLYTGAPAWAQFTNATAGSGLATPGDKDGGLTWADFNDDGCLDAFANTLDVATASRLYLQDTSGASCSSTFTDVTQCLAAGLLAGVFERSGVWADLDNDGDIDFARDTTTTGGIEIYRNNGPGFTAGAGCGTGVSWSQFGAAGSPSQVIISTPIGMNVEGMGVLDYDLDGDIDLFADNHDNGIVVFGNDGSGNFAFVSNAVTGLPGAASAIHGDYVVATDFQADGDVDILARKNGLPDLYLNVVGSFVTGSFDQPVDNTNKGGAAACDFDNDGDFDLFWTDFGTNQIWEQTGAGPTFTARGVPLGIVGNIDGVACGDIDNDGDIDLMLSSDGNDQLFRNEGGFVFTDISPASFGVTDGEAVAFGDTDRDGDLDLLINQDVANELWRNNTDNNNYLMVRALYDAGGAARDAMGATATLRDCSGNLVAGIREVNGARGHGSQDPAIMHFGLPTSGTPFGPDSRYVVRVQFLGGGVVERVVTPSSLGSYQLVTIQDTDPSNGTCANYRSIGTAADYIAGTITATLGSRIVNGTGTTWVAANRGRGDRIDIGGKDYTILSVDLNDKLTLTEPVTASYSGAYTMSRQFTGAAALVAWETCISGGGGCLFFPVATGNLVAEKRSEVGIAYDETTFTDNLVIDGSTTDASHFITLTAGDGNRHYGRAGGGVVLNPAGTGNAITVQDDYTHIEWLEITGWTGASSEGVRMDADSTVYEYMLVHGGVDTQSDGFYMPPGNGSWTATIRNTIVYNVPRAGINLQNFSGTRTLVLNLENVTAYNNGSPTAFTGDESAGVSMCETLGASSTINATNVLSVGNFDADSDLAADFAVATRAACNGTPSWGSSAFNLDSDGTAPGASPINSSVAAVKFASTTPGSEDLHIQSGSSAQDTGVDLSASFAADIDGGLRQTPWDVGADDIAATTEVELLSFQATGLDGAIELTWETGSEIDNLGFHLYRSASKDGPYERVMARVIPGLGSSPEGARYRYRDEGLSNGQTYLYELEDIETTGRTERHGPVSATPRAGVATEVEPSAPSGITYGEPETNGFEVTPRGRYELIVELETGGFYAEPQDDGSVRVSIPGFEDAGAVPVKRAWVDVLAGRQARVVSVRAADVEWVSLRPSEADVSEVVASFDGTVRAQRRRARRAFRAERLTPSEPARIIEQAYQSEAKKALLELAPLRWDPKTGRLLLARRLVVRLSLKKPEASVKRRVKTARARVRLVTREPGLYGVRYEELFRGRRGLRADKLRLSRQGETTPFYVPASAKASAQQARVFRPGSTLYFVSEGADANPYGNEAVYELQVGTAGERMKLSDGTASGAGVGWHWARLEREENHLYQAALLSAPDPWLWDYLFAPVTKRFAFTLGGLAPVPDSSKLSLRLQGASDFPASPDHHVRILVNDTLVGEASWDGKRTETLELELPPGVLLEGNNELSIDNVGDTEADYSMVMLDGFDVTYLRTSASESGVLKGTWEGVAELAGFDADTRVVDLTETAWLAGAASDGAGSLRFGTLPGHRYLAVRPDAVRRPEVRRVPRGRLARKKNRADYVVIAPEAFLPEVEPLLTLRREQGLRAQAVSVESIFSEFGHGEDNPEAIRAFLRTAYHEWRKPSLRYVVLVGDATYDFKDFLQTGVKNQVPPLMVKTTYLWTASDPAYAAVNGDDRLPDIAIGRLPAASLEQVRTMVSKILAYEHGDASLHDAFVLVADNADAAGDFEADARALTTGVLASESTETVFLSELGTAETERKILTSFDDGTSLVSYLGHGGIHLWASENVFDTSAAELLASQRQQPLVVTMNCLNGYFHFPYFDALSEKLVKLEGRGAIAAISPSGLSLNEPAERLHRALLQELVHGNHQRLGDALLAAQAVYTASGAFPELLSIYHLFGDPALALR